MAVLTGLRRHPLVDSWFKVPLSELLSGYTFPTVVSPSRCGRKRSRPGGFGWEGTHIDPVTGENVIPWSGTTFKWDPLVPLTSFYDSLTADPDTTGVFGTGVHVPSLTEIARAFQALLAGLVVDFNPLVPGSPACPGICTPAVTSGLTTPVIVKFISDVWPGNPLIEKWLDLEKNGLANGTTPEQVPILVKILQQASLHLEAGNDSGDQRIAGEDPSVTAATRRRQRVAGHPRPRRADEGPQRTVRHRPAERYHAHGRHVERHHTHGSPGVADAEDHKSSGAAGFGNVDPSLAPNDVTMDVKATTWSRTAK